ncbi:Calcineurin-like phosphoesterase [Aquisphaera giovannonii]|uniref:Calcineurin-like phosphoesterase n=1 Tax=Aquisphaera giovannonii TaxID=406548 RepID=A0A5B9VZS8_9BACT|nr:metallophosphoesterase [Aquisphaera giovannonii]QEH33499.1 Calcineurin-like phosphoesterase [Aquisphaera giovannonii]
MEIWAIADLHLSFARPDRRERYAARWRDHADRIEANWRATVGPRDLVLLPGDLSMGRNHREIQPDLAWIARLPGRKVLSAGNHDTWWNGVDKVRPMMRPSIRAVGGDALEVDGVIVCGTRGAPAPAGDDPPESRAAAAHELGELERALEMAATLRQSPSQPVYLLWHYPPFDSYGRPGPWVDRIEQAGVSVCVYGHLHTEGQWSRAVQGNVGGVRYYCVAADAVGFRPLRVGQIPHS